MQQKHRNPPLDVENTDCQAASPDRDVLDAFDPDEACYEPLPEHGDFDWEQGEEDG